MQGLKNITQNFISLPKSVIAIGVFSCFLSFVIQIVQALLPVYMVKDLGFNVSYLGVISGVGVLLSTLPQLISSVICDKYNIQKKVTLIGCFLAILGVFLFPFSKTFSFMFLSFLIYKSGLGIVYPSIYSIIAKSSSKSGKLAQSFGFRASLSYLGGTVGPLLVSLFLMKYSVRQSFFLSIIPLFVGFLIVLYFVKKDALAKKFMLKEFIYNIKKTPKDKILKNLKYKKIINMMFALFGLAKVGDAFIVLKASSLGVSVSLIAIVVVFINLGGVLFSYPIGRLADKIGFFKVLIFSCILLCFCQLGFVINKNYTLFLFNCLLWGGAVGITNALLLSLVFDGKNIKNITTDFSIGKLSNLFASFLSAILCGFLWDFFQPTAVFIYGLIVALIFLFYSFIFSRKVFISNIR